ncbi:MAG TPA: UDP-N-acetylglucosamine 2-epimerase (non-hydrolyzing) [Longimicrobiales bacterium]|nr:UDP-N-acetylglucosamine 2-epimerase (non-hydrolyzing) [Longimicrobiales bacterium]
MRVLHVVGARPNFMKVAPVMAALAGREDVEQWLVHTGQHYDRAMSGDFFVELGLPDPDVNLGVGSGTHAEQTADVMRLFDPAMCEWAPDLVIVVGDVNSTLACALVAAKRHVPVAHVEAGLRSGDRRMPEEINRVLTDQISDLLFTTSRDAGKNLAREGVPAERVHFVGNTMIDTLALHLEAARALGAAQRHGVEPGTFALVTLHRPSNVDDPHQLAEIFGALRTLAEERAVLFPMHPRTRQSAERHGLVEDLGGVAVLEPVGYLEMVGLTDAAGLVLTDSGGVQEETTYLGVPCVTLRSTTERPVTITQGTNRLVPRRTKAEILNACADAGAVRTAERPELWDGRAAERIADFLTSWAEARGS